MITTDDVKKVAELARLELTGDELERMTAELAAILGHIAILAAASTEHIAPTAQAFNLRNVMRPDRTIPSLPAEAVLANAPDREDNYFRVQAVLDDEAEDRVVQE